MLIYEYRCMSCLSVFEKEVNIRVEKTLKELGQNINPTCPKCSSSNTTKLVSLPNTIFRGKGFTKAVENNGNISTESN